MRYPGEARSPRSERMADAKPGMRKKKEVFKSPGYRIGGPQPRAALCLSTVLPFIADIVHF